MEKLKEIKQLLYDSLPTGKIDTLELINLIDKHLTTLDNYIKENNWISVKERVPKNGQTVYVLVQTNPLRLNQTMATYYNKHTVECNDIFEEWDDDFSDIINDIEYVPEGFYESMLSAEKHYLLSDVLKWKPLLTQ